MIDRIVAIATLPIAVIGFLNIFGILSMNSIFGLSIVMLAAIAHILNQIANVISAHISDEYVVLSYIIHTFMLFPSVIYFLSKAMTLPATLTTPLPIILVSFIFVEGIYSFFM
jgi:hypothetical protein